MDKEENQEEKKLVPLEGEEKLGKDPKISPFRKLPELKSDILRNSIKEWTEYTGEGIATYLRARDEVLGVDWSRIADEAVAMYMTGRYTKGQIASFLNITEERLCEYVDFEKAEALLSASVVERIYKLALRGEGDKDMLKFIASKRLKWDEGKGVNVNIGADGQVEVDSMRPVINVSFGVPQKEAPAKKQEVIDIKL